MHSVQQKLCQVLKEESVHPSHGQQVLAELKLAPGTSYSDELQLAQAFIGAFGAKGEQLVGDAYFKGTTDARDALVNAN